MGYRIELFFQFRAIHGLRKNVRKNLGKNVPKILVKKKKKCAENLGKNLGKKMSDKSSDFVQKNRGNPSRNFWLVGCWFRVSIAIP